VSRDDTADRDGPTATAPDETEGLGRAGWVLVIAVVVSVLVVPGLIYLWPAGGTAIGATYRSAMLVLPMVPALVLGLIAVWSMRDRR
jgi:hypothetical protein